MRQSGRDRVMDTSDRHTSQGYCDTHPTVSTYVDPQTIHHEPDNA